MKHMRAIVLAAVFLFASLNARSQSGGTASPELVQFIAGQLLDSTVSIGVFEVPGAESMPRTLSSGVMPELEDGYLEETISKGVLKLNVTAPVRGSFDSLIFIRQPMLTTDEEEPSQFWSYSGTRWLLFLQSCYDEMGRPRSDWVIRANKPRVKKYINPVTAYDITDFAKGALCLWWNPEFDKLEYVNLYDESLAGDLKSIVDNKEKLHDPVAAATFIAKLQTATGKQVAEEMSRHIPADKQGHE